jgi:hypothetical protein
MDCSCGQFYGIENKKPVFSGDDDDDDDCSLVSRCYSTATSWSTKTATLTTRGIPAVAAAAAAPLDASFVHLPTPSLLSIVIIIFQRQLRHRQPEKAVFASS